MRALWGAMTFSSRGLDEAMPLVGLRLPLCDFALP
jgi:hypothetical protein